MGDKSSIEWTEATWNPVRGCSRVSPGCEHCYAEIMAARFSDPGQWGHGFAERGKNGARWTRKVALLGQDRLELPTRWKSPRRVFVNSTSDLFHESLSNSEIAAVFGVMAQCPQHTFQVLTKRATRMREWFRWVASFESDFGPPPDEAVTVEAVNRGAEIDQIARPWPLPNVWLGVSVENQDYADERIPELLRTPAAVRFVSYEPALGPVDFKRWLYAMRRMNNDRFDGISAMIPDYTGPDLNEIREKMRGQPDELPALDWIIAGGESGPGARPFDIAWARNVVVQCRDAGVACFVKQLGSAPREYMEIAGAYSHIRTNSKKGGDMDSWPIDLRVRNVPQVSA